MIDQKTTHLLLPLPHPDNDGADDVLRLRAALTTIDGQLFTLLGLLASDDVNLDTVQEIVTVLKDAQGDIGDITGVLAAKASTAEVAQIASDLATTQAALASAIDALATKASLTGVETLTNKTIAGAIQTGPTRSGIIALAALDIDCSLGTYFTKTVNGASTFTVSNVPAGGAYGFTLKIVHTSGAINLPASFKPANGKIPTLTAGKTHLITAVTDDGASWRYAALPDFAN